MRTIGNIDRKAKSLKAKLMKKELYENFGEREKRELKEYIGCVHDYPYFRRNEVFHIIDVFDNWCMNWEGR